MTLYKWSTTAATNGTADSTCPAPEGMAPSTINDSMRGMMAAVAKHRDDISGQIATAGTSTIYTVSSFQGFDTLANMHGKEVWFTPHATNGATVTLNVDGLGAKPLRAAPGVELPAGVMVQGTPIGAIYNNTDGAWYLKGLFGNPFNVPLSAGMDYWGLTIPNSSFAFPIGQQISQTTYAGLYALFGSNRYGADGGGLFFLPDKREKVSVMKAAAANLLTSAVSGVDGGTLGAVGGLQSHTLLATEIPTINTGGAISGSVAPGGLGQFVIGSGTIGAGNAGPGGGTVPTTTGTFAGSGSATFSGTASLSSTNTGGQAHTIVQPTIVCNYIIRIL